MSLDHRATARDLAPGQSITGTIDCREGVVARNAVPPHTTARLEYELSPPTRCAHIDLVDATGTVVKTWTDIAWCNGRIRGVTLTGSDQPTYVRAIADTCTGPTELTLTVAPQ